MQRIFMVTAISLGLWAQAPKPVVGTVTAADSTTRSLTVKADDGSETKVVVAEGARVAQIPPGETSLQNAKPAELSAVTSGDRVLARGTVANNVLTANLIVLMSKTDIAKKQQQEQTLWATKGISGIVTAVDKAGRTVTVNSRGADGVKSVQITLTEKTSLKRYAEGSVKYADAKASTLDEVEVNDQVRALGSRSEDGASYSAEQLISGAFRNMAVTVRSINATEGWMEVTDLDTKKPVIVRLSKETNLKKLPDMAAQMMAMAMNGGFAAMRGMGGGAPGAPGAMGMRPGSPPASASGSPSSASPSAGASRGGPPAAGGPPGGMRRGGDMMGMVIDRSPAIQLTDLKKDDPLILSVSKTKEANRVVAITVLAGVEPILATPANGSRAMQLGTWNLDGGAGMMGGGMGGGPQ
jgi:hypothetical protein